MAAAVETDRGEELVAAAFPGVLPAVRPLGREADPTKGTVFQEEYRARGESPGVEVRAAGFRDNRFRVSEHDRGRNVHRLILPPANRAKEEPAEVRGVIRLALREQVAEVMVVNRGATPVAVMITRRLD